MVTRLFDLKLSYTPTEHKQAKKPLRRKKKPIQFSKRSLFTLPLDIIRKKIPPSEN